MNFSYPERVAWRIDLSPISDPLQLFGNKAGKRVRRALEILATQSRYRFETQDLITDHVDTFLPLYYANIHSKDNPTHYDVVGAIQRNSARAHQQKIITLYDDHTLIGGFIYNIRPTGFYAMYKVFPLTLAACKLPISPTYVAEYYFFKAALEQGATIISHGVDNNLFGFHSAIGLAMFKLSLQCVPVVPMGQTLWSNSTPQFSRDLLIFTGDQSTALITDAVLVSTQDADILTQQYPILFQQSSIPVTIQSPL